jgi:hypothetical protein
MRSGVPSLTGCCSCRANLLGAPIQFLVGFVRAQTPLRSDLEPAGSHADIAAHTYLP